MWTVNTVLAAGIGYFFYFFFISDYYTLRNVRVEGMQYVSSAEFLDVVERHRDTYTWFGIPTDNLLLYSKKKLRAVIDEQYLFHGIRLDKQLPDTLHITVQERRVVLRVFAPAHEYLVDDSGVVVKKINSYKQRPSILSVATQQVEDEEVSDDFSLRADNDQFTRIVFEQESALRIGQHIMQPETIQLFLDLADRTDVSYPIASVSIPQAYPQYMTLHMQGGWNAILNSSEALEVQLQRLALVIEQEVKPENLSRIEYIDLRLGNNIYYRYK